MIALRFKRSALDIAPKAQRYTPGAWRFLAVCAFFFALCTVPLVFNWQRLQHVISGRNAMQEELLAQTVASRSAAARQAEPATVQRVKAQERLQQMIRMSWFGLFDALETAAQDVRGGVSLLSLTPAATQGDSTQVRLTAIAASAPLMLQYIRGLRRDPRIVSVEITSHQPDDQAGPGVLRTQLVVVWDAHKQGPLKQATDPVQQQEPGLVASSATRAPVARVVVRGATQ